MLRGLLARDPDNGPALEQLSQLLMDEGRSQEAVTLLSDAAGNSSSPEIYDLLGDAYSQSKDYAKAEDAYRKAVEEDPDDPGHLHGLAQALMAQDKYAEALEQFKRLTELEPGTSENYLRMAQLYRRLGKFDQAEASLLRAKQLAPGSLEVLYNEALLVRGSGPLRRRGESAERRDRRDEEPVQQRAKFDRGCFWNGADSGEQRVESERAGDSLRAAGARVSRSRKIIPPRFRPIRKWPSWDPTRKSARRCC